MQHCSSRDAAVKKGQVATFIEVLMDRRKPLLATKEFFALWFLMLLPSISPAAPFPVATTTGLDFGINAAFDGTNYLLTIDGNDDAPDNIAAQFIDQSGNLVGSKIIMGRNDRMS